MADNKFVLGTEHPQSVVPLEVFGGVASQADLDAMTRVFSAAADRPDLIPQTFLSYLIDYIQTSNIQILTSQIVGQTITITPATAIQGADSITSGTYVSGPSNVGPSLASLEPGNYVFLIAAVGAVSANTFTGYAALSVNGSTPNDYDGVRTANVDAASLVGISQQRLANSSNSVELKFRTSGGTATFSTRQLIAIRYANL